MSSAISSQIKAEPWWRERMQGLVVLACAVVCGLALGVPSQASVVSADATSETFVLDTLYSWTGWILLAELAAAGSFLTFGRRQPAGVRAVVAAVGAVVAAQLAGTGLVAVKHWEPFFGMSGYGRFLPLLQLLAAAMAGAGLLAVAVCLGQVFVARDRDVAPGLTAARIALLAVGGLVVVALPWILAGGVPEMQDTTSLAALALIYSLPWGVALALAGWFPRAAGVVACVAVLGSVLLALGGPPMKDLVFSDPKAGFVVALAAAALATLIRAGAGLRSWTRQPTRS